ncbi:CU044_5270 family protein [Nonomuraea sp. NPDC003727]
MDDEIRIFAEGRPAVPPYPSEARETARRRLVQEATARHRFRLPRIGWQAAGAFGLTVALVGGVAFTLSATGRDGTVARPAAPVLAGVSDEPAPKPGQFVLVESETMYTAMSMGEQETRYLYRTKRRLWRSADASADGLLSIEGLEPKQFPGWPMPEEAGKQQGKEWMRLANCPDRMGEARSDHAYLATLPADADGMRAYLEKRGKVTNNNAFGVVGDLIRETYLPRPQREALFNAAKALPGVEVAEGVEDGAGRKGTALGSKAQGGMLEQLVFDPTTFMFMGERGTVVDAKSAGAPVGSVLALTAQTSVSVVDALPAESASAAHDSSCEDVGRPTTKADPRFSAEPTAPVSAEPTLPGSAESTAPAPGEPTVTVTPVPDRDAPSAAQDSGAPPRPQDVPAESAPQAPVPTVTVTMMPSADR